jgi:adenylate kinase
VDFTRGYLNQHHGDLLNRFVEAFTEIGAEQAKRNAFSGGSYKILSSKLLFLDMEKLDLEVVVEIRGKSEPLLERVSVPLDAELISGKRRVYNPLPLFPRPSRSSDDADSFNPVDDMVRRLCRLCWMVRQPAVTGKLIQLAIQLGGSGVGSLKENLYLNQVPHNRYVRRYFYDMAANATLEAVVLCSQKKISNRMKIVSLFPEMNPSMDSYRYV